MTARRAQRDASLRLRYSGNQQCYDPFAVNPVRRSTLAVLISAAIVFGPSLLLGSEIASLVLMSVGWFAAAVMIISIPVLVISVVESLWRAGSRRLHPAIDELDLSPHVESLLRRHGFETIASIERASDSTLMLLSNFDARALHEVRRAVSLRGYAKRQQRWEEERQRDARRRAAAARSDSLARRLAQFVVTALQIGR